MKFADLDFAPHHRAASSPGKTHANATLPNGATLSVVFTPVDPLGPNNEPYEIQASSLDGPDGDGIFWCVTPADVQSVMDEASKEVEDPKLRLVAQTIYDAVYLPGEEIDGGEMPPFDEAEAKNIGGYERAVEAAKAVLAVIEQGS